MDDDYATRFGDHPRYRPVEGAVFDIDGMDFEARVHVESDRVLLISVLPTLDATVTGEQVAPVVEDGWFETFERRVVDAPTVTGGEIDRPTVTREGATIRVETAIGSEPDRAPDDALAVANYVEGTWIQGIIPGYSYDDRVRRIRDRARQNGNDR